MPRELTGKRRDQQFTVQASLTRLKEVLPPFYFTPLMETVTDGKAVGEVIRMVGPDEVFVHFPENLSGFPVSFTIPRQFLIPITCRPLAKQGSGMSLQKQASCPDSASASPHASFSLNLSGSKSHLAWSKEHHEYVDLHQHLGADGEPAMCVVCGKWDDSSGQKRRSGHKCSECIGQKSLERLRREFKRLAKTEHDGSDEEEQFST